MVTVWALLFASVVASQVVECGCRESFGVILALLGGCALVWSICFVVLYRARLAVGVTGETLHVRLVVMGGVCSCLALRGVADGLVPQGAGPSLKSSLINSIIYYLLYPGVFGERGWSWGVGVCGVEVALFFCVTLF